MVATFIFAVPSVTKQGIKLLLSLTNYSLETTRGDGAPKENAELLKLVLLLVDVQLQNERQNVKR